MEGEWAVVFQLARVQIFVKGVQLAFSTADSQIDHVGLRKNRDIAQFHLKRTAVPGLSGNLMQTIGDINIDRTWRQNRHVRTQGAARLQFRPQIFKKFGEPSRYVANHGKMPYAVFIRDNPHRCLDCNPTVVLEPKCTIENIYSSLQSERATATDVAFIKSPQRDYLPALTGLRFTLAVWVIMNHIVGKGMMLEDWTSAQPWPVARIFHAGYLAVQTFFVLSGFVLARTYAETEWNRGTLTSYAAARFARIYPVYLLSLILVSPFAIEMMLKSGWDAARRFSLMGNYFFVFQGWTGALGVGWNTPAWTLSCEFFFYAAFPLLFLALRRARWAAIGAAFVVALILPIALDHAGVPWRFKPLYHTADFIAGIAAARMFVLLDRTPKLRDRGYLFYLPALAVGAWLVLNPHAVDTSEADLNTWLRPVNVLLIAGLALSGGWLARLLSTRPMDFLGKASYSMYILHVPLLWWYGRYYVHGKLNPPRPFAAALYILLVIAASGAVYQWLEAPASVWIRNRIKSRFAKGRLSSKAQQPAIEHRPACEALPAIPA